MIGFLGEYEVTLDAKGRFLLPAGIKKQLPEGDNTSFVISRGFEPCITLYPKSSWDPIYQQVAALNSFDPKVRQFQRFFLNGATPVELDSASRLLVTKPLLEYAGITRDAILVSHVNKIEIWDVQRHKQFFDSFTPESFSALANEVMNKPPFPEG